MKMTDNPGWWLEGTRQPLESFDSSPYLSEETSSSAQNQSQGYKGVESSAFPNFQSELPQITAHGSD